VPLTLVRIDDRLLHGKVTHGWCPTIAPELVVVADDEAAADEWQREAYIASGPEGAEVNVVAIAECAESARRNAYARPRTLLLVRTPKDLLALLDAGCRVERANVGKLHKGPGRSQRQPNMYVGDEDIAALRELESRGVTLAVQDLPGEPSHSLQESGILAQGESPE